METSVTNATCGEEAILLGFSQEGGILTEYFFVPLRFVLEQA